MGPPGAFFRVPSPCPPCRNHPDLGENAHVRTHRTLHCYLYDLSHENFVYTHIPPMLLVNQGLYCDHQLV